MKKNADGFVTGLSMALMADAELDEKDKLINSLRQQCTELKELIAELEAQQRWIPVSERLPDDGQIVLAHGEFDYWIDGVVEFVAEYEYDESCEVPHRFSLRGDGDHKVTHKVTHWMPLPEPPEVK